jgi:hypothetical protein
MSRAVLFFVLLAAAPHTVAAPPPARLLYRGTNPSPLSETAKDQHGKPFKISGLSGITWAGGKDFYAVCDNSNKVVRFEVSFKPDCSIKSARIASALTVGETHDYEGAAFLDDATLLLSEEDTPGIHAFALKSGMKLFDIAIPQIFARKNIVKNQGFESLTLSPDKKRLFTANERATISDGNSQLIAEPFSSSTRVRIQRYTVDPARAGEPPCFTPGPQFLYQTSGVHAFAGQIGLCDLVALDGARLIALERSAGETLDRKPSIRTRIYLVDTNDAADVSAQPTLKDPKLRTLAKTLLYDGFIFDDDGENLEGLCLGPEVAPGRYILLGCVDNTDGIHVSESRLVAFEFLLPASSSRPAR